MEQAEFLRAFPSYCPRCQGWGVQKSFSPDVRIWECDCLIQRTCPRCGTKEVIQDPLSCALCGWNIDDKERGLPGSDSV